MALEQQQGQADSDDPDRDQRAPQHDPGRGGEDAGPARPHPDVEPLAQKPVQRAAPGKDVAALERAIAVVRGDPALGTDPDFGVFPGLRQLGRLGRDDHREIETAVFGCPVAALPA